MNQSQVSKSGYGITPLSRERIDELAKDLTVQEREVLLSQGTERPFCGGLLDNKKTGTYLCRLCGLPLFRSDSKFDSGTGWPSFFQPFDSDHIHELRDASHGRVRTEIRCARCDSHLGHVFDDGPPPTGLRYCLNSVAMQFQEGEVPPPDSESSQAQAVAYFAGGCFWGVEDEFQKVPGVIDASSGYMGGHAPNPEYKQVCSGTTGHAETVKVTFDPAKVSYRTLLETFYAIHDPTQRDRQGPDVGTQYRSAIFAADDLQLKEAHEFVSQLQDSTDYAGRKIVTQIERAETFHRAEEYHQDYHAKHGGSCRI